MQGLVVAVLVFVLLDLAVNTIVGLLTRHSLKEIHLAVNSNMTRALNEVSQLHEDVSHLVRERNRTQVDMSGLQATEKLAARLLLVVDDIQQKQEAVAANLVLAQQAVEGVAADLVESKIAVEGVASDLVESKKVVEGVAADLAESHQRADDVAHDEPAGTAADAASKLPPDKEE